MEVIKNLNNYGEVVEESLLRRGTERRRLSKSSSSSSSSDGDDETITETTNGENGDLIKPLVGMEDVGMTTENKDGAKESVYFDQNKGDALGQSSPDKYIKAAADLTSTLNNADIQIATNAIFNDDQNGGNSLQSSGKSQEEENTSRSKGEVDHIKFGIDDDDGGGEETDEEVIELEFFEREAHKVHTHNMYCPNCSSRITKVVLRRRKVKKQSPTPAGTREGLFGCSSCFSIFESIGKALRPFPLWNGGEGQNIEAPIQPPASQVDSQPSISSSATGNVQNNQGKEGFNCLEFIARRRRSKNLESPEPPKGAGAVALPPKVPSPDENNKTQPGPSNELENNPETRPLLQHPGQQAIDMPEQPGTDVPVVPDSGGLVTSQPSPVPNAPTNAEKPEIIKCMVYGGLTESITSLSVISSAAASDATTLNIVALGLANLIGGLFVLGHNLLDLKNDQQEDRYREQLGQKRHFLLHATLAILSYLVFGLVPPVVYGFTFRETDDRDYKVLAVAAASFVCIVILAIAKAYTQTRQQHKPGEYLKTIMYYLTTAVMASGVGFGVGELVKKFMEKLGWFETNQAAATLLFPGASSQSFRPSFTSY